MKSSSCICLIVWLYVYLLSLSCCIHFESANAIPYASPMNQLITAISILESLVLNAGMSRCYFSLVLAVVIFRSIIDIIIRHVILDSAVESTINSHNNLFQIKHHQNGRNVQQISIPFFFVICDTKLLENIFFFPTPATRHLFSLFFSSISSTPVF